jgi:hypothetical protein
VALLAEHPFPMFVRDLPYRDSIHALLDSLQKHHYLNTNLLLYSIWFAVTEQGRLRRPEFKKLESVLHPWHERITLALQRLSNSLEYSREFSQWVREEVEVANQFELQMLAQALPIKSHRRNLNQRLLDASHNLVTYYKTMRAPVNDMIRANTLKVLQLFFVDVTPIQIAKNFDESLNAARLDDSGFIQFSLV